MSLATKEQGIQTYLEINSIPIENAAVIGDSINDIGMMKLLQNSFCMIHGDSQAKKVTKRIVRLIIEAIECL